MANQTLTGEAIERGDLPPALDATTAPADAVLALMHEYFRVWNARDASALHTDIYRLGPHGRLHSEADFRKVLDQVIADGWDYSTLDEVSIHPWGDDAFLANGRYSRFTAKGEPLEQVRTPTAYVIKRFPDGLRIVDLPLVYR